MAYPLELGHMTTEGLKTFLSNSTAPVVVWPVGSTEPHGPHMPLATDIILSRENAMRSVKALRDNGIEAVMGPPLPYGVTDFAEGFKGAMTVPHDTLVSVLTSIARRYLDDGFVHVCIVNHHLEPGQLSALKEAKKQIAETHGRPSVSIPQVISRRWGRDLGDEFRSGACHAGAYEGSLVLASTPDLFHRAIADELPKVEVSLSEAIQAGMETFLAAGAHQAYTGMPKDANVAEGERLYDILTNMVVCEVTEHLEMRP